MAIGVVIAGAVLLGLLGYLFIEFVWLRPKRFEAFFAAQGIPSEGYRFLVGRMPRMKQARQMELPWKLVTESREKYGRIYTLYFGPFPRLMINSASHLQDLLVRKAASFRKPDTMREMMEQLLGQGLVVSEGALWKKQRTIINPAFHFANLKRMLGLMSDCTVGSIARWESEHEGELKSGNAFVAELHKEFSALTLDIIGCTAFGSSFRNHDRAVELIYGATSRVLGNVLRRFQTLVALVPVVKHLPLPSKLAIQQDMSDVAALVLEILEERRSGKNVSLCEGKDLLDLLIEARDENGQPMDAKQLKDELLTFVMAGHETTSNLMSWLVYRLCLNPEAQDKCLEEIDRVLPNLQVANYETLKQLCFVDACIDETLRINPPVAMISREPTEDVTLNGVDENGNPRPLLVPKGTGIEIAIRMIHHDAKYWPDPEKFDPTRFLAQPVAPSAANESAEELEKLKPRHQPCTFLPFAAGPRSCIGSQFAKLEAKVMIAGILQRYRLELEPGQKIVEDYVLTVRPKYGLRVRMTKRS